MQESGPSEPFEVGGHGVEEVSTWLPTGGGGEEPRPVSTAAADSIVAQLGLDDVEVPLLTRSKKARIPPGDAESACPCRGESPTWQPA